MNSNLLSPDRLLGIALLVLLVTLAIWRSAAGTRLDSLTIDEPWHIVAGTVYARTGDFSLNPEHPPLTKLWVGAMMPASFIVPPRPVLQEKSQERHPITTGSAWRTPPQMPPEPIWAMAPASASMAAST
ncbi:hypothetical protein OS187_08340 [Xanthomonadaceae bacterium JHOS43]|nr:hypothetical protein [Xanthomonadaceae bacterium JHOS43]MCX7563954.1 hypothetical protein [Xanthomonadaceae bacterium XH05]